MVKQHLDPKVRLYWLLPAFGFLVAIWLVAVAGVAFIDEDQTVFGMRQPLFSLMSALGLSACVLLPLYIYYALEYNAYTYEFTEQAFVVRNGVLATNEIIIPYAHMSRIEAERSILERLMGLSSIEIVTPGPKEQEINHVLPGIPASIDFAAELQRHKSRPAAEPPWVSQAGKQSYADRAALTEALAETRRLNQAVAALVSELRAEKQAKGKK